MKQNWFLLPLIFILILCNGPIGPEDNVDISVIGNWIPSTTTLQQYTQSGAFVSDTSYSMFDLLKSYGQMKYVKIDSTMVTAYSVYSNELVYGDTSYCDASGDSIRISSTFHGTAKIDSTKKEFIIKEKGNLYITAEYLTTNPSNKIVWKTKLIEYDSILPDPAWAGNVQFRKSLLRSF